MASLLLASVRSKISREKEQKATSDIQTVGGTADQVYAPRSEVGSDTQQTNQANKSTTASGNSNDSQGVDLYGFLRDKDYLLTEKKYHRLEARNTNSRDLQWFGYLKSIGGAENLKRAGIFEPSHDLKQLVRRGIPTAYRALVWSRISLSSVHRAAYSSDYYTTLVSRINEIPRSVAIEIEKDVDRTFPEHEYFGMEIGIDCLRRVLLAFALHCKDIGYCQSLNFIVGMMLLFMEEEDAFWLLVTIIEKLLPLDYYTKSMVGTYTDQLVLMNLIKTHLPKVHKKLLEAAAPSMPNDTAAAINDDLETNPITASVTVQWFLCLFVNTLRPEVCLRVWDIFFNEGDKALFKISIALFKHAEKSLLQAKDWGKLLTIIRNIGSDIVNPDQLMEIAYKSFQTPKQNKGWFSGKHEKRHNDFTTENPRLNISKFNSAIGQVPRKLIGIGIAHIGLDTNVKVAENSSTPSTANDSKSTDSCDSYKSTLQSDSEFISPTRSRRRPSSIVEPSLVYPSPVTDDDIVVNIESKVESLPSDSKYNTKAGESPAPKQVMRRRSSVRFSSQEIDVLRQKSRPCVEARYQKMESARKKQTRDSDSGAADPR